MHEFRDETGLWATAGSASSAKDLLARRARTDDAIPGAAPRKIEPVLPAKRARGIAGLWRYGPHAALAAWMIAVAWMAGSHFDHPVRTVVQQESAQEAEMSRAAQNMAEDPHAQKARVEPSAAQTLSTKDATGPGDTKPGLEAAKIEMSGGLSKASGKVERLRPQNPRRRLPKQASGSIALDSRSRRCWRPPLQPPTRSIAAAPDRHEDRHEAATPRRLRSVP